MKESTLGLLSALILVAAAFVAVYQIRPPDPVSATAPAREFSSERAMKHLEVIAAHPHPIGTPEHAEVRDYILRQLTDLGLAAEVQTAEVQRYRSVQFARFATVKNIVARIPGTQNSKAILLLSHYDSVPNSPGATDDGAGVVTMLETARALKASRPIKNDVILLFTDGEEIGLMGAKAFVEQHPWAREVGLVLNFEGSGSGGPVMMFETSDENGWLIEEFAKAAPYPVANSLSYEIYKRMPNDTDLTIFKDAGFPGLNFAYIDNRFDYHTNSDNVENIEEGSLQHHGSYALALTRHMGNLDLQKISARNAVYFNSIGFGFFHYSESWVVPLLILTILAFIAVSVLGWRAQLLTLAGVIRGLFAFIVSLVIVPLAIAAVFGIMNRFFEGVDWWLLFYQHKLMLVGFVCLAITIFLTLQTWFRRGARRSHSLIFAVAMLLLLFLGNMFEWMWVGSIVVACFALFGLTQQETDRWDLIMGHLFGGLLLTAAVSIAMPGGSFLLTWPLLLALIALGILLFPAQKENRLSRTNVTLLTIFAIPAVMWFTQFAYLIYIAMGINLSGIPILLITVLLGLLTPHLQLMTSTKPWRLAQITGLLGLATIMWIASGSEFDTRHRKPTTIFYGFDADKGESVWASTDSKIEEWTLKYFTGQMETGSLTKFIPTSSAPLFKSSAPSAGIAAPEMQILKDEIRGAKRFLQMRLSSPRGAPYLNIFFGPGTKIIGAMVNGMKIKGPQEMGDGSSSDWWRWRYFGLPREGILVNLELATNEFEMKLMDVTQGLPGLAGLDVGPAPSHLMPAPYTFANMTLACQTFSGFPSKSMTSKK